MTYQEVRTHGVERRARRVCGRAARVELFEGHARSGTSGPRGTSGTRSAGWRAPAEQQPESLEPPASDEPARGPHGAGHRRRQRARAPRSPGAARAGADVVVVGRRPEPLAGAVVAELGSRARAGHRCDVADADVGGERWPSELAGDGDLDPGQQRRRRRDRSLPLTEIAVADWDDVFARQRPRRLPDVPGVPAADGRRGSGDVINVASVVGQAAAGPADPVLRRPRWR